MIPNRMLLDISVSPEATLKKRYNKRLIVSLNQIITGVISLKEFVVCLMIINDFVVYYTSILYYSMNIEMII